MGARSSPRVLALAIVLVGVLAHVACLGGGFFADDYSHQLALAGELPAEALSRWSLYDFGRAPEPGSAMFEGGAFPWWTSADWRVRFFRPLTSLSLVADHALFGRHALGYHATSLLLLAALLWVAWCFYQELGLSTRAALLALAFLALDDGKAMPVGWIANRNSLLEALCAASAMLAYLRARGRGDSGVPIAAIALALLATLAKESGLATLAAIGLWEGLRGRRGSAFFVFAIMVGYVACFVSAGFGAASLFYPSPIDAPLAFLERLGVLVAMAPLALTSPFTPDILLTSPALVVPVAILALALAAPPLWLVAGQSRGLAVALPLASWALLALLPQAGAPPSDRLMLVPMLAVAPLLAHAVDRAWSDPRRGARLIARGLLLSAGLASGLALLVRASVLPHLAVITRSAILGMELSALAKERLEVFWLQSPSELVGLSGPATWTFAHGDGSARLWPIQLGGRGARILRESADTFVFEALDSPLLSGVVEPVYLSPGERIESGRRWSTALFEVTAVRVDALGLWSVRVRLPDPLEAPGYRFLAWSEGRMGPVAIPAIGEELVLPALEPLMPFLP